MAVASWEARSRLHGRTVSRLLRSADGRAIRVLLRASGQSVGAAPSERSALTLVELLVVFAVLAVVAGLLLPAVQAVRQAGYRTQCTNNQRVLGQAVAEYVHDRGHFPGWRNLLAWRTVELDWQTGEATGQRLPTPRPTSGSWAIALLPYLDRNDLVLAHGEHGPAEPDGGTRGIPPNAYVEHLVCPVDTRAATVGGFAPHTANSYVVNCGMKDSQRRINEGILDAAANGVFHNHFRWDQRTGSIILRTFKPVQVSTTYIRGADGLSTTLLLAENIDSGNWGAVDRMETDLGMFWWPEVDTSATPPTALPPQPKYVDLSIAGLNQATGMIDSLQLDNPDRQYFGRPSSHHPGGVVATFCDGHVEFLSDEIDYLIYCLLMTPDGRRAIDPATGRPVHELFRTTPLTDDRY